MSKPDIVVNESKTTVIKRIDVRESADDPPKFRMDPSGSGSLRLGARTVVDDGETDRENAGDGSWDIELSPKWGTINLGGGAGENSDGDLKLYDNPDGDTSKPRVHLSASSGKQESARAHLDGQGNLELGGSGEDGRIEFQNADGNVNGFIDIEDHALLSLTGAETGPGIQLHGPNANDLDGIPRLGLFAREVESGEVDANANILAPGGLVLFFVKWMQGRQIDLVGNPDENEAARIHMQKQGSESTQEIRRTADGVVITDADGNAALEIAEDGTVSTKGNVEEL